MRRKGLMQVDIQRKKTGHYPLEKMVIGLMKDELGGKIMTEFVALKAKMYAYRKIDKEVEEKRCKGTKRCVVSEVLTFDGYNTYLFDGETIYREQMLFENKKHDGQIPVGLWGHVCHYKISKKSKALKKYIFKDIVPRRVDAKDATIALLNNDLKNRDN